MIAQSIRNGYHVKTDKAPAKLFVLVFILLLSILGIGIYGLIELRKMDQNIRTIVIDRMLPLEQLTSIRHYFAVDLLSSVPQVVAEQITYIEAATRFKKAYDSISYNWKLYTASYATEEEKQLIRETSILIEDTRKALEMMQILMETKNGKGLDSSLSATLIPTVVPAILKINELIKLQIKVTEEINHKNNNNYEKAIRKFLFSIMILLFFTVPYFYFLVRNIKDLIKNLKLSNQQTKANEEKWRASIKYAGDIIFILNNNLFITEVNNKACEVLGYSREEFLCMKMSQVFAEPGHVAFLNQSKIIEGEKGLLHERRLNRKNGEVVYAEMSIQKLDNTGYISIIRDISDRKKAESAVRQSEEAFRSFIDHAADSIFMVNKEGVIVNVNKSATKLLLYSKRELIGKSISDLNPSVDSHAISKMWELLRNNKCITDERQLIRKNRTKVDVEISRNVLPDGSGAIAIVRDITERKKSEEHLKQSEANYRQLFEQSPVPMWVVNQQTKKIDWVNQASINKYGYSVEQFRTMKVEDISLSNIFIDIGIGLSQTTGNSFPGIHQQHTVKSGERIDVELSSIPVVLNDERKLLIIIIDVTEKIQYEMKLTRAAIKAQEEERYEIGGELHDNVCQVLASSLIYLELMRNKLASDAMELFELTKQYIKLASAEIRNLSHRLAPTFFDEQSFEDAISQLLKDFNAEEKYNVVLYFDENAKEFSLNRDLLLNMYRITQEQLRNIDKHANATEVTILVLIKNNKLHMTISDNGIGFDLNVSKGGIGLANINRRVQLHSGKLTIDTSVGNGCSLKVEMPV